MLHRMGACSGSPSQRSSSYYTGHSTDAGLSNSNSGQRAASGDADMHGAGGCPGGPSNCAVGPSSSRDTAKGGTISGAASLAPGSRQALPAPGHGALMHTSQKHQAGAQQLSSVPTGVQSEGTGAASMVPVAVTEVVSDMVIDLTSLSPSPPASPLPMPSSQLRSMGSEPPSPAALSPTEPGYMGSQPPSPVPSRSSQPWPLQAEASPPADMPSSQQRLMTSAPASPAPVPATDEDFPVMCSQAGGVHGNQSLACNLIGEELVQEHAAAAAATGDGRKAAGAWNCGDRGGAAGGAWEAAGGLYGAGLGMQQTVGIEAGWAEAAGQAAGASNVAAWEGAWLSPAPQQVPADSAARPARVREGEKLTSSWQEAASNTFAAGNCEDGHCGVEQVREDMSAGYQLDAGSHMGRAAVTGWGRGGASEVGGRTANGTELGKVDAAVYETAATGRVLRGVQDVQWELQDLLPTQLGTARDPQPTHHPHLHPHQQHGQQQQHDHSSWAGQSHQGQQEGASWLQAPASMVHDGDGTAAGFVSARMLMQQRQQQQQEPSHPQRWQQDQQQQQQRQQHQQPTPCIGQQHQPERCDQESGGWGRRQQGSTGSATSAPPAPGLDPHAPPTAAHLHTSHTSAACRSGLAAGVAPAAHHMSAPTPAATTAATSATANLRAHTSTLPPISGAAPATSSSSVLEAPELALSFWSVPEDLIEVFPFQKEALEFAAWCNNTSPFNLAQLWQQLRCLYFAKAADRLHFVKAWMAKHSPQQGQQGLQGEQGLQGPAIAPGASAHPPQDAPVGPHPGDHAEGQCCASAASQRPREPFRVFAEEYPGRQQGATGYTRHFVVATYVGLWRRYQSQPDATRRHWYEVLRDDRPCHLYFDLEYSRAANPDVDGDATVDLLVSLVRRVFRDNWGIALGDECFVELHSFQMEPGMGGGGGGAAAWGLGPAPAGHGAGAGQGTGAGAAGPVRAAAGAAGAGPGAGEGQGGHGTSDKWSRHLVVRAPGCAFAGTLAVGAIVAQVRQYPEASRLWVVKEVGDPTTRASVVDMAVYSRMRHFRIAGSCKGGKKAVLLPTRR